MSKRLLSLLFIIFTAQTLHAQKIQKLSLDLTAKTLSQGKYISLKAEVYYQFEGGVMVTNMISPFALVIVTV